MQLLKPSSPWYAVMPLLLEASANSVHSMQQCAQLATYAVLVCCLALQVVVMDSILVHLHHDSATVSQNLCRHHSSTIVCCEATRALLALMKVRFDIIIELSSIVCDADRVHASKRWT